MPPANTLGAHQQYLDIWGKASASPKGIRVRTSNPIAMRQRLYSARAAERKNNQRIFPEDHINHGRSYYDDYIIKCEQDAVVIFPSTIEIEGVEEL
jgi:hypothetical protein